MRRSMVTRPWKERPALIERCLRVYKLYYGEKKTYEQIMPIVGISFTTVWRDLTRARELSEVLAERSLDSLRTEGVLSRRHTQSLALEDRELATSTDAAGKASLIRTVNENQTSIEELQGVREKGDGGGAQQSVTLIQIGADAPKALADMSPDERAVVKQHLLAQRAGT